MNILELSMIERSFDYMDKLIIFPLEKYGRHKFNSFDREQLAIIIQGYLEGNGKSIQSLASDFGHYTKNWNIDWDWISHHILWDYYNIKKVNSYLKIKSLDIKVIKEIEKESSLECRELYLSDPSNINSEPKAFALKEIINNGSNIGKPKEKWKPVIGITDFGYYSYHPINNFKNEPETEHYYDRSSVMAKMDGYLWDEKERCYKQEERPMTERLKKIHSLIKITVTTDDGVKMSYDDYIKKPKK
jgi:hypothetical protein